MKWRMMSVVAAAGSLLVSTAFADYMIVDVVGGCATDGYASNSGTRMPGSIGPALKQLAASGNTVQNAGGGRYNFYINGCLEGYVLDLDEAGSDAAGADGIGSDNTGAGVANPAASSSIAVHKIIRRSVFTPATPKASSPKQSQPEAASGDGNQPAFYGNGGRAFRLDSGAADVFYNKWKIGDVDGETFGINPSATLGEGDELTLTLPLHVITGGDDTICGVGVDGSFKHQFSGKWEMFSAGAHAYGMGFFGGDDTASTFGGGPFLAFNYRIAPQLILSVGTLLEFTKPDEGDMITELVPGVNLGFDLTDNLALNVYGIYYRNLDSDTDDDGYADVGGDLRFGAGSWSLSVGAKAATGLDDIDSTEVYLGSEWRF